MISIAHFDALYLTSRLETLYGDTSLGEILVFCYLSFILHKYAGGLESDWGYQFGTTEVGTPFSSTLAESVFYCQEAGFLQVGTRLKLSPVGADWVRKLTAFSMYEERRKSLDAATEIGLFMASGNVRMLIEREPSLAASRQERHPRLVPDSASAMILKIQFERVLSSVGHVGAPLLVAAAGWMKILDTEGSQPI